MREADEYLIRLVREAEQLIDVSRRNLEDDESSALDAELDVVAVSAPRLRRRPADTSRQARPAPPPSASWPAYVSDQPSLTAGQIGWIVFAVVLFLLIVLFL